MKVANLCLDKERQSHNISAACGKLREALAGGAAKMTSIFSMYNVIGKKETCLGVGREDPRRGGGRGDLGGEIMLTADEDLWSGGSVSRSVGCLEVVTAP